jgi:hypothetical protein
VSLRKRRYRSAAVERDACLNTMGLLGKKVNYDHRPPLSHRPRNADDTDYEPAENDARYIFVMLAEENAALNRGDPAIPLSGDTSVAAKLKRLSRKREAFIDRLLRVTDAPRVIAKPKRPWPKGRKMQSRPFPERWKR